MTATLMLHDAKSRTFDRELVTPRLWEEILPLLAANWREVGYFKDILPSPNVAAYERMQEMGILRVFTVRDGTGDLGGYSIFIVVPDINYSTSLQATMNVTYLDPAFRGSGAIKFLR